MWQHQIVDSHPWIEKSNEKLLQKGVARHMVAVEKRRKISNTPCSLFFEYEQQWGTKAKEGDVKQPAYM